MAVTPPQPAESSIPREEMCVKKFFCGSGSRLIICPPPFFTTVSCPLSANPFCCGQGGICPPDFIRIDIYRSGDSSDIEVKHYTGILIERLLGFKVDAENERAFRFIYGQIKMPYAFGRIKESCIVFNFGYFFQVRDNLPGVGIDYRL